MFAGKIYSLDIIHINSCDSVCVQIFTKYDSDYSDNSDYMVTEICV